MELIRIESNIFSDIFEGVNGNKKVTAILDENCVRYMVFKRPYIGADWKLTARREFSNTKKILCITNATKVLNK